MSIKFKSIDYFIIIFFFAIFFFSLSMIITGTEKQVLFISSEKENYEYDLTKDIDFFIEGICGKTYFSIREKKVFITDSPCQNKTCVQTGKISKNGQWLCCAPNKVFAIIKSSSKSENSLDAISF